MITFFFGENSFEISRGLTRLIDDFDGEVERFDGVNLEIHQLPDLLMGTTLFANKRLVIIKELTQNKILWDVLGDWLERLSDDVQLVLVESKPDKRSKTYKQLQKKAMLHEPKLWGERDASKAEQWVTEEAARLGFSLDKKSAHSLVVRVGVDQWLLYQALQKLALVEVVNPEAIARLIEANPAENVFGLFEAALKKDVARVRTMLEIFQVNEDPYRVFGLLGTQAFQLAALAVSEKSPAEVARDLGAHPFVISKLAPFAKKLGQSGVAIAIAALDETDAAMKTSAADPWLLIERALLKIAAY